MQRFKAIGKIAIKYLKQGVKFTCDYAGRGWVAFNRLYKGKIRPMLGTAFRLAKNSPRFVAATIAAVILVSGAATVALATDATTAYAVMCNGKTVAYVKDASVLAEAEILAAKLLASNECQSKLADTELASTVVSGSSLVDSVKLADLMICSSSDILKATVLRVDGAPAARGDGINNALQTYLNDYKLANNLNEVEFAQDMQVLDIYILKSVYNKLPLIGEFLLTAADSLSVQAVSTVTVTERVAYDTIKKESQEYAVGTQIVERAGVYGSAEVTYKVSTLDGKVTKKTAISKKVTKKPVSKIVIAGTRRVIAADKNGDAPMMWPLKRVDGAYVSSYLGDGRGHKGMDLVSPKGTPIYAAEAGTVVKSGWDSSGYGYKIVIKHANNLQTLYAHCSALYVKAGDIVARGETIGAVGTTGRSTGNHLHFEVHKNGVFVNPVDYIGYK